MSPAIAARVKALETYKQCAGELNAQVALARGLHAKGDLSEPEYERICQQISGALQNIAEALEMMALQLAFQSSDETSLH